MVGRRELALQVCTLRRAERFGYDLKPLVYRLLINLLHDVTPFVEQRDYSLVFNGATDALLPLYAIGVFTSFTLSQSGMVLRWWRLRPPGRRCPIGDTL